MNLSIRDNFGLQVILATLGVSGIFIALLMDMSGLGQVLLGAVGAFAVAVGLISGHK